MGIRESLLNTITSVGSSDFVRIVTSAGASSKATLQNVIKSFETGLGAKSSLTDSDYIRLVGSDNNLYKQSMSSVYDAIGVKFLGNFTASSDEDTIKAALTALKTAYSSEASSTTNKPKTVAFFRSGAWGFVGTAWIRSTTISMTVVRNDNGYTYFAKDVGGTQTVTLMPTRDEMDGSVRLKGSLTTNTDLNILTVPGMYQLVGAYTNMPSGLTAMWGIIMIVKGSAGYVTQVFYRVTGGVYIRNLDNGTWGAWEQVPTRAEINALNSTKAVTAQYGITAINKLKTEFASYATGFSTHQLTTGGPMYMALVYKYSDTYGCAILMTYSSSSEITPSFVQCLNGTWTNGVSLR